jgi:formyltetrahydrofolate deformylase
VLKSDTLESIKKKGQQLEAETLFEAVKLYLEKRLEVYWGKVFIQDDKAATTKSSSRQSS